jgi:hypothetical protein
MPRPFGSFWGNAKRNISKRKTFQQTHIFYRTKIFNDNKKMCPHSSFEEEGSKTLIILGCRWAWGRKEKALIDF